jgi:hypothetical protein
MALPSGGGGARVGAALAVAALLLGVAAAKLDDVVQPSWANDHVVYDGDLLKLRLDPNSGSFGARISASRHPSFFFGGRATHHKICVFPLFLACSYLN